ncbi:ABC transporter permease [Caldithrix abyssi]
MYIQLSWRNIWRNKKRTLIAVASVFFAVITAVNTRSMQLGSYDYMIHSTARFYSGYLQIQNPQYWEKRSLENSMVQDSLNFDRLSALSHVMGVTPRLEAFTLLSFGSTTRVGQVIGIDPSREDQTTGLRSRLVEGSFLNEDEYAAIISQGLARMLGLSIGDSLVLYGQAYHGQIAAALLPIKGIVQYPIRELNNTMVYLPLKTAQDIFLMPGRITSVVVLLDGNRHLNQARSQLLKIIPQHYRVIDWQTMLPELYQSIQLDNVSGMLMLAILYVVIAFGLFGTILMMINERRKEFGILIAVGMKKSRILLVTMSEIIFISLAGALSGILGALPLVLYFTRHPIRITGEAARSFELFGIEPIFSFSSDPTIFFNQALVVFLIALATFIYPVFFLKKLEPHEAMHA